MINCSNFENFISIKNIFNKKYLNFFKKGQGELT